MRFIITIILLLVAGMVTSNAMPVEKIILKKGDVIIGYISKQETGKVPEICQMIESSTKTVNIPLSEIECIETDGQSGSAIVEELVTKNGSVKQGIIYKQIVGKGYNIRMNDGSEQFISYSDVLMRRISFPKANSAKLASSLFWDSLTTNKGVKYNGLIVEQYFGQDVSDVFYTIALEDGTQHTVKLTDIRCKARYPNPNYREDKNTKTEVIIKEDFPVVEANVASNGQQCRIITVKPDELSSSGLFDQISNFGANNINVTKIPQQYVSIVSMDDFSQMEFPSAKISFLNTVPYNSYQITVIDGHANLTVLDKTAFWGVNKYVIICVFP